MCFPRKYARHPTLRRREKKRGGKRENDSVKVKDIKKEPSKTDSPQYAPKCEPAVFPAKFLEDVITEMVNKLVFSSSPETQTYDRCQNVCDDENQAELYDTAMRLIDSLLKEFSDAQIKVFRPDKEYQFFPPADKVSSVPKALILRFSGTKKAGRMSFCHSYDSASR